MKILLTNDDGIHAIGIRALYQALVDAGHTVTAIAPMTEQSAVGHSITLHSPLRVKAISESTFSGFGVHGTPADCVKLAVEEILPDRPDIVVSGINAGANVGPDILYSGTVAAATEAAHLGCRALAVSFDSTTAKDLTNQAAYTVRIMEQIPWESIPHQRVMNLNLPDRQEEDFLGLAVCPQTSAVWRNWYIRREDPRKNPYWWLDGVIPPEEVSPESDRALLSKGWATLTPLKFDFTDVETMENMRALLLG